MSDFFYFIPIHFKVDRYSKFAAMDFQSDRFSTVIGRDEIGPLGIFNSCMAAWGSEYLDSVDKNESYFEKSGMQYQH